MCLSSQLPLRPTISSMISQTMCRAPIPALFRRVLTGRGGYEYIRIGYERNIYPTTPPTVRINPRNTTSGDSITAPVSVNRDKFQKQSGTLFGILFGVHTWVRDITRWPSKLIRVHILLPQMITSSASLTTTANKRSLVPGLGYSLLGTYSLKSVNNININYQ